MVEKITANTFANNTTYNNEEFVLLQIVPRAGYSCSVTYGGVTKIVTSSLTVEDNSNFLDTKQVFFGTFNGQTDEEPTSVNGELIISGECVGFYESSYNTAKSKTAKAHCVTAINSTGKCTGEFMFDNAFKDNQKLRAVHLSSYMQYITAGCFYGCSNLSEVILPKNLLEIEYSAFQDCSSLINIPPIPNSVTEIGDEAFSGCTSLNNFILPDNLEIIGQDILYNTPYYNDEANWFEGGLYYNNYLLSTRAEGASSEFQIKNGTTVLAGHLFDGKDFIISTFLPKTIEKIGVYCFANCANLISVYLSSTQVKTIPSCCCAGSMSLADFSLPRGLLDIGISAFSNCYSLNSIKIPNSVISIGQSAYANCKTLQHSIGLSGGKSELVSIGVSAFSGCESLTGITIPKNTNKIGAYAFENCTALTQVTFEDTSTWYTRTSNDENVSGGIQQAVTSDSYNATLLTQEYVNYYWFKE